MNCYRNQILTLIVNVIIRYSILLYWTITTYYQVLSILEPKI